MGIPSPVKIKKDGVEYISKIDRTKYTLKQLIHGANKDVGKLITRRTREKVHKRTGRGRKYTQYWARKDGSLLVGFKPAAFYLGYQELGAESIKKTAILTNTVQEQKNEIRKIQGTYIKSIEDENKALGLIKETEEQG